MDFKQFRLKISNYNLFTKELQNCIRSLAREEQVYFFYKTEVHLVRLLRQFEKMETV